MITETPPATAGQPAAEAGLAPAIPVPNPFNNAPHPLTGVKAPGQPGPNATAEDQALNRRLHEALMEVSIHCSVRRPYTKLATLGIPERSPILGDWFYEGDLGFVFAPRGLGKTWLSLALAIAIANGSACGPWLPADPAGRKVLYVDGEMPCHTLCQRIAGMGGGENVTFLNHEALFFESACVLNLTVPSTQQALTTQLVNHDIKVLFLDNLSCLFSGLKENDADSWEHVLGWLLTLRRHRIAVVVVHHSGRNLEMRGTSRREDAAFWVIRLDDTGAETRDGAQFLSRFTKDRNSPREQSPIAWKFRTEPDGRVQLETQPADQFAVLRQWIEDGLTSAEDIAREMGVSKGTVSKMARRAMDDGWLCKHGREYALTK